MSDVLAVILGGGKGTRLYPLTKYRSKPAVPLAGKYRLIDIPISNCLNSNVSRIFVLTQYNSASLNRHINLSYHFDTFRRDGFVDIIAAEQTPPHQIGSEVLLMRSEKPSIIMLPISSAITSYFPGIISTV